MKIYSTKLDNRVWITWLLQSQTSDHSTETNCQFSVKDSQGNHLKQHTIRENTHFLVACTQQLSFAHLLLALLPLNYSFSCLILSLASMHWYLSLLSQPSELWVSIPTTTRNERWTSEESRPFPCWLAGCEQTIECLAIFTWYILQGCVIARHRIQC